jgi:alpha-L-fucosidase 2
MQILRGMNVLPCLVVTAWICLVQGHASAAEHTPHPAEVIWNSPSKDSRGSMPIGNGDLGANVWVEPSGDLVFYLSKTDAWSENCRLLKLGRVRVKLDPPLDTVNAAFTQTLDPLSGLIRIESKSEVRNTSIRFWIDAYHPLVQVDVESNQPLNFSATAEIWRTARRELKGRETHSAYGLHGPGGPPVMEEADVVDNNASEQVVVYQRNRHSIWLENLKLQALGEQAEKLTDPLLNRTFGFAMAGEGLTKASDLQLESKEARKAWSLRITALTQQTETAEQWKTAVQTQYQKISSLNKEERFKAHQQWWTAFWQRSWIEISGDLNAERITRAYALQRWINAGSGRGAMPIKFNGSIFTMDEGNKGELNADYRSWGGPYWWQNTRWPYWSMIAAGDEDLMEPLFKMYLDALPLRKAAIKKYYDHGGAYFPETQYFWGTTTDANYGRVRKNKPDGLTDNAFIRRYWQGSIELVMMLLDHYEHTQDAAFRDKTLLPLAVEITTFFNEQWPRNEQGKIHFEPAQSLETYHTATNPLPEIVGLRAILPRLMKLPVAAAQQEVWRDMLDDLPPVPTVERDGKTILAPAEKWANKANIENPELYAVFPYREYTLTQGGQPLETALATWRVRTSKESAGWHQTAIQAALLGLTDEAKAMVKRNTAAVASGHRFPAIWGPNYDWMPDQCHGGVIMTALQKMAIQCAGDQIYVLPAWPKEWNVHFKLHAPQRTTVEVRYSGWELKNLIVIPESRRKDVVLPKGIDMPAQ